jgi:hypothetical protein
MLPTNNLSPIDLFYALNMLSTNNDVEFFNCFISFNYPVYYEVLLFKLTNLDYIPKLDKLIP